jgi:outer membrane immunogenic protein
VWNPLRTSDSGWTLRVCRGVLPRVMRELGSGMIMRRSLLLVAACAIVSVQAASAADMPIKAPAHAPVAVSNWTGFYLGGQVGGGWASNTQTNIDATGAFSAGTVLNATTPSGVLGGVYGGYNYQINQFLAGVDVDYSYASLMGGNATDPSNNGGAARTTVSLQRVKTLGTATGRLGYIFNNNLLFFGKGGWAWSSWSGASTTTSNTTGAVTSVGSNSTNRNGWTLGTGAEWAFAAHWSAKLEYDYVKFNTVNFNSTDVASTGVVTFPARSATSYINIVKVGAAYRF